MIVPETQNCIITLDGPAGAGKSSISRNLADHLGLQYLDTGAMYRAVAKSVIDQQIDVNQPDQVQNLLDTIEIRFNWDTSPPRLLVNQQDITDAIRTPEVSSMASQVAVLSPVRKLLVQEQRAIGQDHPRLVTEGRDQGSVVFKDAQVKIYLDASPRIRAQRRAKQLAEQGTQVDVDELEKQIIERDTRDSSRADSPLVQPDGCVYLDTSDLSFDQVLQSLSDEVYRILGLNSAQTGGG